MTQPLNRRAFVTRTLAAAAAAGATWFDAPRLLAARADALKKYGGFPMGLQSYSLRAFGIDGPEGALAKIHELGLHYVEFFRAHFPPTQDQAKIDEMKEKLKKYDLTISAHGVQGFNQDHAANEAFFKFAKAAGIRNISADPTPDAYDSLDKLCAQYDIRIAIHNHGPGARFDKLDQLLAAVKGRHPHIGACADLGHYIRSAEDPVEVITKIGNRLFGVHLKDFAEQKKEAKGVILGKGHLDVVGVFKALKKVKFPADGALSLEYEENPKDPMGEIKECLAIAAEAAQKAAKS
jgi:inosose dehydratase